MRWSLIRLIGVRKGSFHVCILCLLMSYITFCYSFYSMDKVSVAESQLLLLMIPNVCFHCRLYFFFKVFFSGIVSHVFFNTFLLLEVKTKPRDKTGCATTWTWNWVSRIGCQASAFNCKTWKLQFNIYWKLQFNVETIAEWVGGKK